MRLLIKILLIATIIFQHLEMRGQESENRFGFLINVMPIAKMGWEAGFEFDLSKKYSFRSTVSLTVDNNNTFYESYRYVNQFVTYFNEDRNGFNLGPVLQIKNEKSFDNNQLNMVYNYGFGLGAAIGFRFALGKKLALIPNVRLMANYLIYKDYSGDPTAYPFFKEHPSYELEPKFVVYFQYRI